MHNTHWKYKGDVLHELPDDVYGFVYRITNKITGKKYIGRKYIKTVRRVKKGNRKNRKRIVGESNWRTYLGSSKELLADIEEYGIENYSFDILAFGYTKGQVNYLEEAIQYKLNVLVDDTYYNNSIGSRKYIGLSIDERFKNELFTLEL